MEFNLIIWNNLKHRKTYHINWVIKCVRLYRLWAFQYARSLRSNQSLNLQTYIDGFEFWFCFLFLMFADIYELQEIWLHSSYIVQM